MGGKNQNKWISNRMFTVVATLLCGYHLLYATYFLERFSLHIDVLTNRVICLGFVLILTFLYMPAMRGTRRDKLPWYDILLLFVIIAGCGYTVTYFYYLADLLSYQAGALPVLAQIIAVVILLMTLEATRRAFGWILPAIGALFIIYLFFGSYFPGPLKASSLSLKRVTYFMYYGDGGLYGIAMGAVATIVIIFLIFGQFLLTTGAGAFFVNLALSLVGHIRGGGAKVSILASAFIGSVTGQTGANILTTGSLTIPLMKRIGYSGEFAGGVETVASSIGQILPPVMGVIAFIMADWLGITYWEVCVASFIPAFIYMFTAFCIVDFEAARKCLPTLPRAELPHFWQTIKAGWYYFIPIIALVFLLAILRYSPQTSCLYAIGILIVLSFLKRETWLNREKTLATFKKIGIAMIQVGSACATCGIIIGGLSLSGLGAKMSIALAHFGGGNQLLLLLVAALSCFILGMGLASIPAYIVVVTFVAPTLDGLGVPLLATHLFVFYFSIVSFLTPPVALGAYIASGVAMSNPMKTAIAATRIGIATYIIPFAFILNPALLLMGDIGDIAIALSTALIGTYMVAGGVSGYMLKQANWWERILLIIGGMRLIFPGWVSLFGLIPFAIVLLYQKRCLAANSVTEVPVKTGVPSC